MDERFALRPAEVAATLGIGRSKAYELIAAGDIPSIRLGGSLRVPVEALRAWIARQLAEGRENQA
jgi:excisionase family DNA binding protein